MKRNRKRRRVIAAVLAVIFLVTAAALWALREPTFEGKSVAEWSATGAARPANEVVNAFGTEACERLVAILEEEDDGITRRMVTLVWGRLSPKMQSRLGRWGPGSLKGQQQYAEEWLMELGKSAEEVFPRLNRLALNDRCGLMTLALVGEDHPDAPAVFGGLIQHTNPAVKREAALAGTWLRERGAVVLPGLTNALRASGEKWPQEVILAIGSLGEAASNAVPLLVNCLVDRDVVAPTLWALTEIGPGAAEAVPLLCNLLDKSTGDEQLRVVKCLHAIGPRAVEARARLWRLKTYETNMLQLLVSLALAEIEYDPKLATDAIKRSLSGRRILSRRIGIAALTDGNNGGRWLGLKHAEYAAVAAADYKDPDLLPFLMEAMDGSGGWRLQLLAARTYWRHTGRGHKILPAVWNGLFSRDPFCIGVAAELLEEMPLTNKEAALLEQFLKDMDRPWREHVRVMKVLAGIEGSQAGPGRSL